MRNPSPLLAAFLGCSAVVVNATQAQSVIVTSFGSFGDTTVYFEPNETIPIVINNTYSHVVVTTSSPNVNIGFIDVSPDPSGGGSQTVNIYVTPEVDGGTGFPADSSGNDWLGITDSRGITLKGRIGGNLLGSILVKNLLAFQADGEIVDDSSVQADEGIFSLKAEQIGLGTIKNQTGNINLVEVTRGSLTSNVLAPNGGIRRIDVAGDIGQSGGIVTITAGAALPSGFHLEEFTVGGSVAANITANGAVGTVLVGGEMGINDPLHGEFNLGNFVTFEVGGNFLAHMTMSDALAADRQLRVGLTLVSFGRIDIQPEQGLAGQVVLNTASTPSDGWSDDGMFKIGPDGPGQVVLTRRGYAESPESLGGGSIGGSPFWLHDEACEPANRAQVAVDHGSTLASIRLRHYGPIELIGINPQPFVIARRPACTADSFESVDASAFEYAVDPSGNDRNYIDVTPIGSILFDRYLEYQIGLPSDSEDQVLVCQDVADVNGGPPPVVWNHMFDYDGLDDYRVTVLPSCTGDFNDDEVVDVLDLLDLLGHWSVPFAGCEHGDTNCDGSIDVTDLLVVLGSWGPCPESGAPDPSTIENAVASTGLTQQDWDNAVQDLMDPEVSQAVKNNLACWWEHYFDCHSSWFCIECACPICPDTDPYGNH